MKNIFTKAFVCAGVMASALALSNMVVFAADGSSKTVTTDGTVTSTVYDFSGLSSTTTKTAGTTLDNGVYFKTAVKGVSSQLNINNGQTVYFPIDDDTNSLTFTITTVQSTNASRTMYIGGNTSNTVAMENGSNRTLNPIASTDVDTLGNQKYLIVNSTSDFKVKKITIDEDSATTSLYTISGTVANDDGYTGTLNIGTNEVDYSNGTYSVNLVDGTYNVTLNSSLYSVSPSSITVNGGAVTQNLSISAVDTATVSGSISEDLGVVDTVKFINSAKEEFVATVENGTYTVTVPQGAEYTVSVLSDSGYLTSDYLISETAVNVTESTATFDLEAVAIGNTWDFATNVGKSLPNYKNGYSAGTNYKGIEVTAIGKFAPQSPAEASKTYGRVQVNEGTTLTLPEFDTDSNKVVVYITTGSSAYDKNTKDDTIDGLTIDGNVITYTGSDSSKDNESIYITKIEVEATEEDTTPSLTLTATQNATTGKARLEAVINNVSADNKITSISVQRADKDAPTAVKNIKKTDDVYSFAVNFGTPASDTHAVLSLTFLKGGTDSTTKTYGFALNANNTIVLD